MKAFFQKNWKKQLFIDFFTRLTNFKWLWKVNSQAFSNQIFFSILIGFQLIKISWKTCARCWHLVLAVPNVKIFFCKNSPFWLFSGNSFQSLWKIKKAELAVSKVMEVSNRLDFFYIFVPNTLSSEILPCLLDFDGFGLFLNNSHHFSFGYCFVIDLVNSFFGKTVQNYIILQTWLRTRFNFCHIYCHPLSVGPF